MGVGVKIEEMYHFSFNQLFEPFFCLGKNLVRSQIKVCFRIVWFHLYCFFMAEKEKTFKAKVSGMFRIS